MNGPVMRSEPELSAGRSLLDRPQRLGFLPTLWFWDDGRRLRLYLPFAVIVAVPVAMVAQYLSVRYPALSGWLFAVCALHPFVVMGLLERHIRERLRQLPVEERLERIAEGAVTPPLSRRVPLLVGGLCAALLAAVTLGSGAALLVLALLAGLLAIVSRPHARLPGRDGDPRPGLPPPREP